VISTLFYYILPKKYRWVSLFITSLIFFCLASYQAVLFLVLGVLISYVGARIIEEKCKSEKTRKRAFIITIISEVAELLFLKYANVLPTTLSGFASIFNIHFNFTTLNLIIPIGISYYTLSIISYVTDVYRKAIPAEKNIFKYSLYACYYPCLVSGPIIRYPEMKKEFFENEDLDWNNIFQGSHRIIYGLLKKMVIADNIAPVVRMIFADTYVYSGLNVLIGLLLYALQIYCDFSGCMDIVIGSSKLYGVTLPENFESPFFSRNLSEFWRRWHITLGLWGKDYIMYPMLKSEIFQKLGKKMKSKFGKEIGKKIPVIISMLILWSIIGIWHDFSFRYIFAAGILPWIYITIRELCSKEIEVLNKKLKIKEERFSFHLFQSIRTLLLMCFIWLFVVVPDKMAFQTIIQKLFTFDRFKILSNCFIINGIYDTYKIISLILSIMLVTIVDYLIYRKYDVSKKFNEQGLWFRYIVLFSMISIILVFGVYGPGYNPAEFIYGGF